MSPQLLELGATFIGYPIAGSLCETETTITAREHKTGKGREVRKKREENTPSAGQKFTVGVVLGSMRQ